MAIAPSEMKQLSKERPTEMPFITVAAGGPQIPDGVYTVTLLDIKGPKTVTAQRGPNAGKDIDLFDWDFAIDAGELEGTEIQASSSTASGPRSKLYAFLTALFGGQSPPIGTQLEKNHLVGRRALATIRTDDQGWPRIDNLSALPPQMYAPGAVPQAVQQPVAPMVPSNTQAMVPQPPAPAQAARGARTPARQQVEPQQPVQGADLPF